MALPTITFNSGTGSDTAASGYGPATAISGTAAATTAASAVVTLTVDNPTLTTISAGDLFWVDSSSGRQYSIVVSVDNIAKTVTVTDNYANTEGTRNWGCGGKRATWDNANSRKLFTADYKAGWTIVTETGQTITTSAIALFTAGDITSGYVTIKGSSGAIRLINTTANLAVFSSAGAAWLRFENLQFSCSNATKTSSIGVSNSSTLRATFVDCVFGDATNTLNTGVTSTGSPTLTFLNCEFKNTLSHCYTNNSGGAITFQGCWLHNAAGSGKGINVSQSIGLSVYDSIIAGNASDGILVTLGTISSGITVERSVIHGNGGDGIDVATALSVAANLRIHSNNITANGTAGVGYGINAAAGSDAMKVFVDYNNFGTGATANQQGSMNNITAGAHDLAVDPGYASAAGNNYTAGTAIKAKGYPDAAINLGTNSSTLDFIDIGVQRQEAASGTGAGSTYSMWNRA